MAGETIVTLALGGAGSTTMLMLAEALLPAAFVPVSLMVSTPSMS